MKKPNRHCASRTTAAGLLLAVAVLSDPAGAGEHPRLLLRASDIPRIRQACGLGVPPAATGDLEHFGPQTRAYRRLHTRLSGEFGEVVLPGEALAAAFLHLVSPTDRHDPAWIALVNNALREPLVLSDDLLETAIALDWCWDAVDVGARDDFLLELRRAAKPLAPTDSPLKHSLFRRKLATLAVVLAVDEQDLPSPAWGQFRHQIIDAAREYFTVAFPTYVRWRGLTPTGPGVAALEENDSALAVELSRYVVDADAWSKYRDSVGRWMEHYLLVRTTDPMFQCGFLRDDGTSAPLTPAPRLKSLEPLTAHLIADRTRDPAAAAVADLVAATLNAPQSKGSGAVWQWVPIMFDLGRVSRVDLEKIPATRNLNGAVILRGDEGSRTTTIWIDTGQPFLRHGQHFDAGHFLLRAGADLLVAGGEDVEFEATSAKGGFQRLGHGKQMFDFAQYFTSTIAHNCMVFWEPSRASHWYGKRYVPVGGQMPRENTCSDFVTPLEQQSRLTARLLACGQRPGVAYVALDLTAAYDPRAVSRYVREFVFIQPGTLIVIDRAGAANFRVIPTCVFNVPNRPRVDGEDLAAEQRLDGSNNDGGVWRYDQARWLRWGNREGVLWLRGLVPNPRRMAIVGGPARQLTIGDGPCAGRRYIGGDADGFEHLVLPSRCPRSRNAWYRLGRPTSLGDAFGRRPHWGRVEIEPVQRRGPWLFATALVVDNNATDPPKLNAAVQGDQLIVELSVNGRPARLMISTEQPGGTLEVGGVSATREMLPTSVEPDTPWPVIPPHP